MSMQLIKYTYTAKNKLTKAVFVIRIAATVMTVKCWIN